MALWHFIDSDGVGFSWQEDGQDVSGFDDGLRFVPGEDGFSSDKAYAKATALGTGVAAVYTGTPNYAERLAEEQAAQEAAKAKADADAAIDALLNPPADDPSVGINAQFDALLTAAPDRADDIAKLRAAALKAAKK